MSLGLKDQAEGHNCIESIVKAFIMDDFPGPLLMHPSHLALYAMAHLLWMITSEGLAQNLKQLF